MATKAENIADWIISVSYEKIPERVIKTAKQQLLGMLGACLPDQRHMEG